MGGITVGSMVAGTVVLLVAGSTALFKFGTWKGGVDEHREEIHRTLREFMAEIRDDMKTIIGRVPSASLTGGSPLRLTKLGDEISRTLDVSSWADRTGLELREQVSGKNDYEIQEWCFDFVRSLTPDDKQEAAIKDCAFEHGIDIQGVLDVFAVEMRGRLLTNQDSPEMVVGRRE